MSFFQTEHRVDSISLGSCGETKGCFLWPMGCSGSDCQYAVTWQNLMDNTDLYQFEMFGAADEYLALGFSHDKAMVGLKLFLPDSCESVAK